MSKSDLTLERLGELLAHEKAAANASKQTITWYSGTLRRYSEWLASRELAPTLANFTAGLVQRCVLDLHQQQAREYHPYMLPKAKPLSDHSVNSYVRALRAFASWLYAEGYTREHVLGRMKAPKTTKIVQDILSVGEIGQVVNALNPQTEIGARDQAIFLVLLDTCMRACAERCGMATGVGANGNTAHRDRLRDSGVEVGGWMRGASTAGRPCAGRQAGCVRGAVCDGHSLLRTPRRRA